MNKIVVSVLAAFAAFCASAQQQSISDDMRQAVQGAIQDAEAALKKASAVPNDAPIAAPKPNPIVPKPPLVTKRRSRPKLRY